MVIEAYNGNGDFFHYCRPITLNFIIKETSIIVRNRMRVKRKKTLSNLQRYRCKQLRLPTVISMST